MSTGDDNDDLVKKKISLKDKDGAKTATAPLCQPLWEKIIKMFKNKVLQRTLKRSAVPRGERRENFEIKANHDDLVVGTSGLLCPKCCPQKSSRTTDVLLRTIFWTEFYC